MSEERISENNISQSLKVILVKKNMNIAKLAEAMGVSSTTMYSKFNRGNFTIKDLDAISDVLNLDYEVSFIIKE